MPIRNIPIEEASEEQRLAYVRDFLNLPLNGDENDIQIRAKIALAQPGMANLFVNEPDTEGDVAATETNEVELKPEELTGLQAGTLGKTDPKAIIFIPQVDSEDGSGNRDVTVGVNGRAWLLKRGEQLPVPWRVVEALNLAVADIVRHRNDEGHEGEVVVTQASRFNAQLIERPSNEAIAEWRERTGKQFCA